MRDMLMRLKAALTPQALLLLSLLLLAGMLFFGKGRNETPLEQRIERTLMAMEGVENVQVTIRTYSVQEAARTGFPNPQGESIPAGAVAVVSGADDPLIRLQLERALCALLGLPPSAVNVISGGN